MASARPASFFASMTTVQPAMRSSIAIFAAVHGFVGGFASCAEADVAEIAASAARRTRAGFNISSSLRLRLDLLQLFECRRKVGRDREGLFKAGDGVGALAEIVERHGPADVMQRMRGVELDRHVVVGQRPLLLA